MASDVRFGLLPPGAKIEPIYYTTEGLTIKQISKFVSYVLNNEEYHVHSLIPTYLEDKYNLLGGVIGAFITITVIRSMGSLGPARAVMLIVISQLAVAYLIELLGIFGVERADFQWRKLLGMLICIAGVVIFKWK